MNLQISGGVDSLTLIDEHGNTVCTFAKCDEETRQVAGKIVSGFNSYDETLALLKWAEKVIRAHGESSK